MAFNAHTGLYEGYIYYIENQVNHKGYIGQTTAPVKTRWYQHTSCATTGGDAYLYRAMRAYGIDKFSIREVCVESATTKEELAQKLDVSEQFYIDEFQTFKPNGYNLTLGGRVFAVPSSRHVACVNADGDVVALYSSIRSAAEMQGLSEKNLWCACNSETHFSSGHFWYYNDDGMLHIGDNIGAQQRGYNNWKGHVTYSGKPVEMYSISGELLRTFSSATEASRQLKIGQAQISSCCRGKRKTAGGYRWGFQNDY